MSIKKTLPADQFASSTSVIIKQQYVTTDYCCCCWSIDGKYYEIKNSEEDKDCLFRADEGSNGSSIFIKDKDGLMFVQLIGHGYCQCGCFPGSHTRIDVHCTPGELVGSIHYTLPSHMLMKDMNGEPIFYLRKEGQGRGSIPVHCSNLITRALMGDPKFEVYSADPDFPDVVGTISRKGRQYNYGQGFTSVVTFEPSLDISTKALVLGAAFPIGLEYFEGGDNSNDKEQYGAPVHTDMPARYVR